MAFFGTTPGAALYAYDEQGFRLVARSTSDQDSAAGLSPSWRYWTFLDTSINDAGTLLVRGVARRTNATDLINVLWSGTISNLQLIANTGVDGIATKVPQMPDVTVSDIGQAILTSDGTVFFSALLQGVGITSTNNSILLAGTSTNDLRIVMRQGDLLPGHTNGMVVGKLYNTPIALVRSNLVLVGSNGAAVLVDASGRAEYVSTTSSSFAPGNGMDGHGAAGSGDGRFALIQYLPIQSTVWIGDARKGFAANTSFAVQGDSPRAYVGSHTSFRLIAEGAIPQQIAWTKDGVALSPNTYSGANSGVLTLANIQPSDHGIYSVQITDVLKQTNNVPGVNLDVSSVTVSSSVPSFGLDRALSLEPGVPLILTATANGTTSFSYRWDRDTGSGFVPIPGATNATLVFTNILISDAGSYRVYVAASDGIGITNMVARLVVGEALHVTTQPASAIANTYSSTTFRFGVSDGLSITYQWFRNDLMLTETSNHLNGTTSSLLTLDNISGADAGEYRCVATVATNQTRAGVFAVSSKAVLDVLPPDGTLDGTFSVATNLNSAVTGIAARPDGTLIVNGPGPSHWLLLSSDGNVLRDYSPGNLPGGSFASVVMAGDGTTYLLGDPIRKVFPSGELDTNYAVAVGGTIYSALAQNDGKLILSGAFTITAQQRVWRYLARFNPDGSPDESFSYGVGPDSPPYALALQPDGKLLLGGDFTTFSGNAQPFLARLNVDGTPDSLAQLSSITSVRAIAVQSDGQILIAGFLQPVKSSRIAVARLNQDGTYDSGFHLTQAENPTFGMPAVFSILVQPDGKILFSTGNWIQGSLFANGPIRFNADGTIDSTFSVLHGRGGAAYALALDSQGRILAGGNSSPNLMRLWKSVPTAPAAPRIFYSSSKPDSLVLSWIGPGVLQSSDNLVSWQDSTNISGATIPRTGTASAKYFRLLVGH